MTRENGKKKISRNILFAVLGTIIIVIALAFAVSVSTGKYDRIREQQEAEKKIKAFEEQSKNSPKDVLETIQKQELEAKAKEKEHPNNVELPPPSGKTGDLTLKDLEPPTLADVKSGKAEQAEMEKRGDPTLVQPTPAGRSMVLPEVYENYEKNDRQSVNATPPGGVAGQPSSGDKGAGADQKKTTSAKTYKAATTEYPPSDNLLRQGAVIGVALVNGINTQNPGQIQLRVTSDVYDSLGNRKLLIPKGSVMIGSFGQPVTQAGLDRVPIGVTRIILPDGRSIRLAENPISDKMGYAGAPAEFHSNLLRAIGPSVIVAWIGYYVDKWQAQRMPVTTTGTTATQPPNISQQIIPKIDQRINERYGSAKPYYTIEPGAALSIVLAQDVVIQDDNRNDVADVR